MAFQGLKRFTQFFMSSLGKERARRTTRKGAARARVLCIASGKGGTGKSVMTANLGLYLATKGKKVLILDADLGLANAHLLLDMQPRYNLSHVLNEKRSLEEIIDVGPEGLQLISGGSGISQLAALDEYHLFLLIRQVAALEEKNDFILIDTSAGIAPQTMVFLYAAREIILVTTPDVTAMTDAYAMMKTMMQKNPETRLSLVANKTRSEKEAKGVYEKLDRVSQKFLSRSIRSWGHVPFDKHVSRSIVKKDPIIRSFPRSEAGRAIANVGKRLLTDGPKEPVGDRLEKSFEQAMIGQG